MDQLGQISDGAAADWHAARSLIEWYWTSGVQRGGRYRIPPGWMLNAYQNLEASASIVDSLSRAKPSIAVWGPSRSGKSTLLSYFLDSPDTPESAVQWGPTAFRFLRSSKFEDVDALNPLNTRSDASGCITRFAIANGVAHQANPIKIVFASRRQLLQALAAGYVMECNLERSGVGARKWDSEQIYGLLSDAGHTRADQSAVELLFDTASVIDRLIEDEHDRYWSLHSGNKDWERVLKTAMLGDSGCASSFARAEALTFELLWDSNQKLTELYAELERYRAGLERRFGNRPVFVSLELASLLLDIDSYPVLVGRGEYDARRVSRSESCMSTARYRDEGGHILIDGEGGGEPLFGRVEEFGLFQALVWELLVPLRRDFLQAKSETAANFLEQFDLLDIPGVARRYQKASSERLDLSNTQVGKTDLLIQVVKRGKTATIINRYAERLGIDAVLLLVQAGEYPAQPAQLIGGVQSIWRSYDPGYVAAHGSPPVPVAVCLTFMASIIDEMATAGPAAYDLAPLDDMILQLGSIVHPNVCTMFATTYPHLSAGSFKTPLQQRQAVILPKILAMKWFQERFRTRPEQDSIRALLNDDDGGVGYLLRALSALPRQERDSLLGKRLALIEQDIDDSFRRACPERNLRAERYHQAIEKLIGAAEARTRNAVRNADDVAQALSELLRKTFDFQADDFQPYPKLMGINVGDVTDYVQEQLDNWVERTEGRHAMAQLGLNDEDQTIVMDAIRQTVDASKVAAWCTGTFGHVTDDYQAHHIRRYVAAKCAHMALPRREQHADAAATADMNTYCIAKYKEWSQPNRLPTASPHFEAIIQPILDRLREIAAASVATLWEDQAGDRDIEKIRDDWHSVRRR